jgi:hypothetical protein
MLVEAAGKPMWQWHSDAWEGNRIDAIVRGDDVKKLQDSGFRGSVFRDDSLGGPVKALRNYVSLLPVDFPYPLIVSFADSLIKCGVYDSGDWVGIAYAPMGRSWDYPEGKYWVRGVPRINVCMGLYRFEDVPTLQFVLEGMSVPMLGQEISMVELITEYEKLRPMRQLRIDGWQDAGDWEAIRRVR